MSERVSDEYLTRIIEQKAGVEPMHLAADLRDARRERDEARAIAKDVSQHLSLANDIVNEAINEAAGAIAGIPDGRPGDRVAAVVERLKRAEKAEALVAEWRPVVRAAMAWDEGYYDNKGDAGLLVAIEALSPAAREAAR